MTDASGLGLGKETASAVRLEFQRPACRTLIISFVLMSCGSAFRAEASSASSASDAGAHAPAVTKVANRRTGTTLFMANAPAQWRAAEETQHEAETLSARPLKRHGSVISSRFCPYHVSNFWV